MLQFKAWLVEFPLNILKSFPNPHGSWPHFITVHWPFAGGSPQIFGGRGRTISSFLPQRLQGVYPQGISFFGSVGHDGQLQSTSPCESTEMGCNCRLATGCILYTSVYILTWKATLFVTVRDTKSVLTVCDCL